jgi:hypothetical protein
MSDFYASIGGIGPILAAYLSRAWSESIAHSIWADLTPIGRVVLFPVLVVVMYALLPLMLLVIGLFWVLEKSRVIHAIELVCAFLSKLLWA